MNLTVNYGKEWERRLTSYFEKLGEEFILYRIPDQMSGHKGSKNPCDFILYNYPNVFWIECKSTVNTSWSLSELDPYQLEHLRKNAKTRGSFSYILLLFMCEPSAFLIPIRTIESLIEKEIGSININKLRKGKYTEEFFEMPLVTNKYVPSLGDGFTEAFLNAASNSVAD